MLHIPTPYLFILLLLLYTGLVLFLVFFLLVHKKPAWIYKWACNRIYSFKDFGRFSPQFRSKLYSSGAIIAIRFNINTGTVSAINQTGADLLGLTKINDEVHGSFKHGEFLSQDSRKGLIKELNRHKRVENYPVTCSVNNALVKMLITAEKYENGDVEAMIIDITKHFNIYQQIEDQYLFLQNILNALPVPVFVRDKSHQYPFTNQAFNKTFGDINSDSFKKYVFLISPDFNESEVPTPESSQHQTPTPSKFQTEFSTAMNTGIHHFEVRRRPLKKKNGQIFGMVGIAADITHRKRIEQDLRETTKRYKNLFWNAAEGITTVQHDGRLTEANPAMASICRYDSPEQLLNEVQFVEKLWRYPEQRDDYMKIVLENKTVVGYDFEFVRRDGTIGWMTISSSGKFDENGNLEYVENIISDITLKKQSEIELTRCATIDSTTGICNRNALEGHLTTLLNAKPATPFAVVFIDLNNFKPVNDNYGHYTGDKVLEVIAQRLVTNCRKTDFAARLGGDEFIVILNGVNNKKTLNSITDMLLGAIKEPILLGGISHTISASAGVSQYPEDGNTTADLLKAADASMYDMKRSRKASKINNQLKLLATS